MQHFEPIRYDDFMDLIDRIKASPLNDRVIRVTDDGFAKYDVKVVPDCESRGRTVKCRNPIVALCSACPGMEDLRC